MSNVVSLSDRKKETDEEAKEVEAENSWFSDNMKKNKEKADKRKQALLKQPVKSIVNRSVRNP